MLALPQCLNRLPPGTQQLLAQVDRLQKIQRRLQQNPRLPQHGFRATSLRPHTAHLLGGASRRGDILTLTADHSMMVTRLKNLIPTLLDALKDCDISEITIKVKGGVSGGEINDTPIISPRPIPAHFAEQLRKIAPNTPLSEVLNKWADSALIQHD